jgi:hypothetical protein
MLEFCNGCFYQHRNHLLIIILKARYGNYVPASSIHPFHEKVG